jgi:hypothetical protein
MKREIARYVSECDICQRVKASHLKTAGVLQLYPFLLGSGKISAWISSLAYSTLPRDMILFG